MPFLLALGLLASPAGPAPVDCTHGVLLLDGARVSCITPAEANVHLAAEGGAQRIGVSDDGRAVVVMFWPLW